LFEQRILLGRLTVYRDIGERFYAASSVIGCRVQVRANEVS